MRQHLLILGGTTEASALAKAVAQAGLNAVFSYAGRVANPKTQPLPTREGGFGGAEGLAAFIQSEGITHVIDATHPFAAQMSHNAFVACMKTGAHLAALTRAPWHSQEGDRWLHVPDMAGAVVALEGAPQRVMLALGRLHMNDFAAQPQHHYILRLVDAPEVVPDLANHTVVVARGPFDVAGDTALFKEQAVDVVVCKNAGGTGASAKLDAARALGLPVIMIDRPKLPNRKEFATPAAVLEWVAAHPATDRGV